MKESHFEEAVLDLNFYRDWASRRKKDLEKDKTQRTFFVTISREFGCEGYDMAVKLTDKINNVAKKSPWNIFTHNMIEEIIAGHEEDTTEMVREVSEQRWSFKDWFIDALVPKYLQSQSTQVFEGMRNLILNFANKGNCVILGAGAQAITHNLDPKKFFGIHVRIVAPYSWRLHHLEHIHKLSREEAEKELKEKENARNSFITDFTGMDIHDTSNYHITFNNAKNSPDMMADIILEYLRKSGALEQA